MTTDQANDNGSATMVPPPKLHRQQVLTTATTTTTTTNDNNNDNKMPYLRTSDLQKLIPNNHQQQEQASTKAKAIGDEGDEQHATVEQQNLWMSISKDVEFLPLFHTNSNTLKGHEGANKQRRSLSSEGRKLEEEEEAYDDDFFTSTQTSTGAHDANNPFSTQPFIEGMGSYDQYAQVSMKAALFYLYLVHIMKILLSNTNLYISYNII